ncbi:MAG TPA: hypothetical protein VFI47_24220 [Acidimicrobiales bacterium]|nr:hypothetical protein [Acidimicrobiales bacterium]
MAHLLLVLTTLHTLPGRVSERMLAARRDDRGEINSNVAWAGLMLVVAVTVGGIVLAAAQGAAGRFDFGF